MPAPERAETLRLALPNGNLLAGGEAAMAALGHVRATRPLERAVVALRAEGLVRALYARIASNRDRLGRFVLDGPAPRRFP